MSAIEARTAELADVQAAIAQAVDGDTVLLPAGTVTWTAPLMYSKALRLIGRGIGATIIHDNANDSLFRISTQAAKPYRNSGMEFRDGSGRTSALSSGIFNINGSSDSVRLDHCRFFRVRNHHLRLSDSYVRGVADHNEHIQGAGVESINCFYLFHNAWAGDKFGDASWSEPIDWGGRQAWYIEDSRFEGNDGKGGCTDTYGGARFVFRHNEVLNGNLPTHGTGDGAGRHRGLRHFEVYENTFTFNPPKTLNIFHVRGGTGIFANNKMVGVSKGITLHYYRFGFDDSPFGYCNGLNAFDRNDPTLYLSGLCGAGSANLRLKIPGAGWSTNQWVGYSVWVPKSSQHPLGYISSIVISNTADTLTVDASSRNQPKPFVEGEYFEIRKIKLGLDMPGAGTTKLLTDKSTKPTPVDLEQEYDPVFIWGNTGAPAPKSSPDCTEGIHFMLTERPGWTPYTYPHPLTVESSGGKPLAPRALVIY